MAVKMLSSHTQKTLNTHLRGPFFGECGTQYFWVLFQTWLVAVCEPRRLVLSLSGCLEKTLWEMCHKNQVDFVVASLWEVLQKVTTNKPPVKEMEGLAIRTYPAVLTRIFKSCKLVFELGYTQGLPSLETTPTKLEKPCYLPVNLQGISKAKNFPDSVGNIMEI